MPISAAVWVPAASPAAWPIACVQLGASHAGKEAEDRAARARTEIIACVTPAGMGWSAAFHGVTAAAPRGPATAAAAAEAAAPPAARASPIIGGGPAAAAIAAAGTGTQLAQPGRPPTHSAGHAVLPAALPRLAAEPATLTPFWKRPLLSTAFTATLQTYTAKGPGMPPAAATAAPHGDAAAAIAPKAAA